MIPTSTIRARTARIRYPVRVGDRATVGPKRLEIDLHFTVWLRATDQQVALGCGFERDDLIVDGTSDQGAFAGVADTGTTRPPDGNVAGLSEFEEAMERWVPWDSEAASR